VSIAAIVRALVQAGATPEMILAAVEAAEEASRLDDWRRQAKKEARRRKANGEPTNPRAMGINPRALGTNPRAGREG